MAFSGSQRTRLGAYALSRQPYGSFAGKAAVVITAASAAVGGGIDRRKSKYPRRVAARGRLYVVRNADEERALLLALEQSALDQAQIANALGDEVTAMRAKKVARKITKRVEAVDDREAEWLQRLRDEDEEILTILFG